MVLTQDENSALKLARIEALKIPSDIQIIENVLEQEGDINFAVPAHSPYEITKPHLIGYTALHFACAIDNINLFTSLLNHGADFTKKNQDGQSALHMLITKGKKFKFKEVINNPFVNAIFQAHIDLKNFSDPCNNYGLSHFHIACFTNNTVAVQLFLENGVSIDVSVSKDSEFFPGYTPLHFAAMRTNTKIAVLLIANGANMHIADAKNTTALHILVKRRLEMYDSMDQEKYQKSDSYEKLQKQVGENDKIINMLLENISSDNDYLDRIGLSNFHVACLLQDTTPAEQLADQVIDLDHCVNIDSQLWPGYTALHFAAHASIQTVKMLIKKGANIARIDSKGLTPLDICTGKYKIEDIRSIISLDTRCKNLLLSDGQTKLIDFIPILASKKHLLRWIDSSPNAVNIRVPMESPLWPGYTLLHLAVLFAEKMMFEDDKGPEKEIDLRTIKFLVSRGADLSLQDSRGRTALHLAFRLGKITVVDAILDYCPRGIPVVSDEEGLSHLHIACAAYKKHKVWKFDMQYEDLNARYRGTYTVNNYVRPGSTPLHVCLLNVQDEEDLQNKLTLLLRLGADPHEKDARGLTPIHRMLEMAYDFGFIWQGTELLFKEMVVDCVAEEYGISHLHVACYMDDKKAVKSLLEEDAEVDVNLAIKYPKQNKDDSLKFLSRYDKCTPLHLSIRSPSNVHKLLLKRGADVFAKKANGSCALDDPRVLDYFVSEVKKKVTLQKRMRREYGWTKLHLACNSLDRMKFEGTVKAELADVNARVFCDSPIWKGRTPLHLLVHHVQTYDPVSVAYAREMTEILLKNGADVAVKDDQGNTPISMLYKQPICEQSMHNHATLLMKHHRDFSVNPVNSQGISHLHLACFLNDVKAVEGFLKHGVDVNRPIHAFADWRPGHTPLHLTSNLQIVDLLIRHGADVHMETVEGLTVLAEALKRHDFDEKVVTKIIDSGADVNKQNFKGETPFEIVIRKRIISMEKLIFCIKQGFIVNSCNSVSGAGYLATVLGNYYKNNIQLVIEMIMNEKLTTYLGRTLFHHLVTGKRPNTLIKDYIDYFDLFEKLTKNGHDIDAQDDKGMTALHLAVKFLNENAVAGLLRSGADVNILDKSGKAAISYIPVIQSKSMNWEERDDDSACKSIRIILIRRVCELVMFKLDLCEANADAIARTCISNYQDIEIYLTQVAKSSKAELGVRSLRLYDFLSETGAIMLYPLLNHLEREKIDKYFESMNHNKCLKEIQGLVKFQYRKAVKRLQLFSLAAKSFKLLLDFDLPDSHAKNIFRHLRNSDLKNIISAEANMKMDID